MRKNIRSYGLSRAFTPISEAELDLIVQTYAEIKPQGGIRYLEGLLRSHGIRLQKMRLQRALRRHNRVGGLLRHRRAIRRRKYHSTRPNALWHCDGHHKLILWGIVIHGFIDGYCRTVRIHPQVVQHLPNSNLRSIDCRNRLQVFEIGRAHV